MKAYDDGFFLRKMQCPEDTSYCEAYKRGNRARLNYLKDSDDSNLLRHKLRRNDVYYCFIIGFLAVSLTLCSALLLTNYKNVLSLLDKNRNTPFSFNTSVMMRDGFETGFIQGRGVYDPFCRAYTGVRSAQMAV